jgi:hypothetical protein
MRRAHTVTFKTVYKDQEITARSHDGGQLSFSCDLLKETRKHHDGSPYEATKSYDNVESILEAIDRYELSLRKDFVNKTAYRVGGGWRHEKNTVYEVTVTSVTDDGKEAWIKEGDNSRSKVSLKSLYNSKEACKHYCDSMNFLAKQYEKETTKAQEILDSPKNLWKPEAK